jgi:tetratricopeptide (TPR) repeat protein
LFKNRHRERTRFLKDQIAEFEHEKTVWHAGDLLGSALVEGDNEVIQSSAIFISDNADKAPPLALKIAREIIGIASKDIVTLDDIDWKGQVRASKAATRQFPDNAIAWIDAALGYTVLGQKRLAERAVHIAILLEPQNRFVLRSAVRFYIHSEDLDRASKLVTSNEATLRDPWLMSAELALASAMKKYSNFFSAARRLAEDQSFRDYDRSELSIAIASLEVEASGSRKRIKKFFKQGLVDPTENAVAQAEWLAGKAAGLEPVQASAFQTPGTFEALANEKLASGKWDEAFANSYLWFQDQPFSARPAIFATFIGSTLIDEPDKVIKIGELARISNPDEATLLNNLAFTYANQNNVSKANNALQQALRHARTAEERVTVKATSGLIAFRQNDPILGEKLYLESIEMAQRDRELSRLENICKVYLAREKMHSFPEKRVESIGIMEESLRKTSSPVTQAIIRRVIAGSTIR